MKKSTSRKLDPYVPNPNKELSPEQREELLRTLEVRFEKNMNRHKGLEWGENSF